MTNSIGDDMATGKHMFLWFTIIFSVYVPFILFFPLVCLILCFLFGVLMLPT